jgi:hypothetical protein
LPALPAAALKEETVVEKINKPKPAKTVKAKQAKKAKSKTTEGVAAKLGRLFLRGDGR